MKITHMKKVFGFFGVVGMAVTLGCGSIPAGIIDDLLNDNAVGGDLFELQVFASNTDGASGIALAPNGDLYTVNKDGLFGPIKDGDDLSTKEPIGATNLGSPEIFDQGTSSLVLAITNSGEFWIGSNCCAILAVVPPEGGPAEPFDQFIINVQGEGVVKPEAMAIVPQGFEGAQIQPGNLLLGQETDFDHLVAIDVEGEGTVVSVDNPDESVDPVQREAHHITFGLDGTFYSSRGLAGLELFGIQTITPDGQPTNLPGTLGVKADSFVGLANGDLIIRGAVSRTARDRDNGLLVYSAADDEIALALSLPDQEVSEDDEMIITPDGGTIFLALPNRNEIVKAVDLRE